VYLKSALCDSMEMLMLKSKPYGSYDDRTQIREIVSSCIGTKFSSRWGPQMVDLAVDSVLKVVREVNGYKECDTKRYVRIEKVSE